VIAKTIVCFIKSTYQFSVVKLPIKVPNIFEPFLALQAATWPARAAKAIETEKLGQAIA
jgi:hypothetical protein